MAIRNIFEHAFKLAENMDNLQVEDVKREEDVSQTCRWVRRANSE